jgi:hypothetical protein
MKEKTPLMNSVYIDLLFIHHFFTIKLMFLYDNTEYDEYLKTNKNYVLCFLSYQFYSFIHSGLISIIIIFNHTIFLFTCLSNKIISIICYVLEIYFLLFLLSNVSSFTCL